MLAGYIYANAGEGESTTDLVFGGHNIIAENGSILRESRRFVNRAIIQRLISTVWLVRDVRIQHFRQMMCQG